MFTGLIEEIGIIEKIKRQREGYQITVKCQKILEDLKLGDSISVNGICLTAVEISEQNFIADLMPESIARSNIADIKVSKKVNLERAMSMQGRLGGHLVSGHIDGIGKIVDIKKDGISKILEILPQKEVLDMIVQKGSVAIDGISLTVSKREKRTFCISAIPHSLEHTTLKDKKKNDCVNLETDVIGKYVKQFMGNLCDM